MAEHVCYRCGDVINGNAALWIPMTCNGREFELCKHCYDLFYDFIYRRDVKGSD